MAIFDFTLTLFESTVSDDQILQMFFPYRDKVEKVSRLEKLGARLQIASLKPHLDDRAKM